ncbi:MAG: 16S rRNA (guanine(1207)-N(2))-methyltransferase RsmC [Candidatus Schmidhempelia sp.]|nr:16S rRNA (guanine(1207)-N(2))-methyltransferase RsmC [Candidatus Schmidhempelia sp.]
MNSINTPASEILARHIDMFSQRCLLIAGDIQDDFPVNLPARQVNIHCHMYHHYHRLVNVFKSHVEFSLTPSPELFNHIDTLIYYWPKTKLEAQFQLAALLSQLTLGADVFIVGENRSGVRSAEHLLDPFGHINKIDSARRCSLYHFQAESQLAFNLDEWWQSYSLENGIKISTLPGVFSVSHLDLGSELLLEALLANPKLIKGHILDLGCGAGVLSAVIGRKNPGLNLHLTDVNAAAIAASKATLNNNNLKGCVFASDVFSDVEGKYDLIISNPPFHDGKEINYFAAQTLIREAKKHLNPSGALCIVANAFLPYAELLDKAFGHHQVLLNTNKFKVYLAN